MCVCVCAIASSIVEIQSSSGPGSDSRGIDQKKANAWFGLEVETKDILPGDAHPHPWIQVTGGEKDALRKLTSVSEFQEPHSPSCSRQPVIDTKELPSHRPVFPGAVSFPGCAC